MGTATLTIDLDAIAGNWRALDKLTAASVETAAVVKADGYGLDAGTVATTLAKAGARTFFVATAEEGSTVRAALGPGPAVAVFGGHMEGDAAFLGEHSLIPMINSPEQMIRHRAALPDHPFGIQLDTGMNRLGMEPDEWALVRGGLTTQPWLVMSHLACADEPDHPQNAAQLRTFREMTADLQAPRSLSPTGGILLGSDFHFNLVRPGIGVYGGAPFTDARPVVRLSIAVIQCRDVAPGESIGYGASFVASRPTRIATVAAGYADGIIRAMSNRAVLYCGEHPCPLAGRVSMDLLTVDITDLGHDPDHLDLLCQSQGIDAVAEAAGTIAYEILTSLGARYCRIYQG